MFFLFFRVRFLSEQIIPESILSNGIKKSDNENADVFISLEYPKTEDFCKMEAIRKPIKVYKKKNDSNPIVSFVSGDLKKQRNLFIFLQKEKFSPQFTLTDKTNLIFAENDSEVPPGFVFDNNFTEFNKISVYVYGNSYKKICRVENHLIIQFAQKITILFILVLFFKLLFANISIGFDEEDSAFIWFVTKTGIPLTKQPKIPAEAKMRLSELLDKVSLTQTQESVIYRHKFSLLCTELFHMHVLPVTHQIFCVIVWREDLAEDSIPPSQTVDGGYMRLDDVEGLTPVKAFISPTSDEKNIKITIPVNIDNESCEIEMTPTGDQLPYGMYSLHETCMSFIHSNIFNQGTVLELSKQSFVKYLENVFHYMNYSILIAYTQNGTDIEPVAQFALSDEILKTGDAWVRKKHKNRGNGVLFKETIGNLRLCMDFFVINEHEYMLCVGYDAGNLIMRSSETRFHFIIAMFIAFNHSVLEKKNDLTKLPRIYDLIENSGKFAIIECVGSPTKVKSIHGNLFKNESIENILHQILTPTVWSKTEQDEFRELNQYQFHVALTSSVRVISVTSTSYFDDLYNSKVYQYLIEDVTNFHETVKDVNFADKIPPDLLASMSNFHSVNKETLKISDPERLRKELGFTSSIDTLSQILTTPVLNDLKNILDGKESSEKVINIIDASMKPKRYGVVTDGSPVFFIYKLPDVSSIVKTDSEQVVVWDEKTPDYSIFVYNSAQDVILDMFNEGMHLNEFAEERIFEPDQTKFLEHLRNPAIKGDIAMLPIRILTSDGFCWKLMKLTPYKDSSELIFVHWWALAESSIDLTHDFDFADAANVAFNSGKVFSWIFENSNEPVRIFRSLPRGVNTLIFNWTTMENNIHDEFKEYMACAINKCIKNLEPVNVVVPICFEEVHWFLFRGSYNKKTMQFSGIAFDMSNLCSSRKYYRLDEVLPDLEKFTLSMMKAKKYINNDDDKIALSTATLMF